MRALGKWMLCSLGGAVLFLLLGIAMAAALPPGSDAYMVILGPIAFFVATWLSGASFGLIHKRRSWQAVAWLSAWFFAVALFFTLIQDEPAMGVVEQLVYLFIGVAGPWLGSRFWFERMMANHTVERDAPKAARPSP